MVAPLLSFNAQRGFLRVGRFYLQNLYLIVSDNHNIPHVVEGARMDILFFALCEQKKNICSFIFKKFERYFWECNGMTLLSVFEQ